MFSLRAARVQNVSVQFRRLPLEYSSIRHFYWALPANSDVHLFVIYCMLLSTEIAREGSRTPLSRSAGGRIADLPSWHSASLSMAAFNLIS